MTPLMNALLLGDVSHLPEEISFLFARTGLLHVFSISGFHLFVTARLADALSFPIRRFLQGKPREAARFAARAALLGWFFAIAGPGAPLVRAAVFLTLGAAARLLELDADRRSLFLVSLLAGSVLGRGAGPLSLALSAASLAGWVVVKPKWAKPLGPWLFTLPLTIPAFGIFSGWAPLWNYLFGIALGGVGLPFALLAELSRSLHGPIFVEHAERLLAAIVRALALGDSLLGGAMWVRPLPWVTLAGALLAAYISYRQRPRLAALMGILGITGIFLPLPILSVLDVGQGDAILIRTAHATLLEDVGPPGFQGKPAPACWQLERLGLASLDDVLLSHFDLDHRGGLDCVLARHAVRGALWFRESDLGAKGFPEVLGAAERAHVPIHFVSAESAPAGLRCWLTPAPDGNDSSPLCRAELANGQALLLTGDMSEKAENWLLANVRPFPRADLLKVAHHGSKTSSGGDFLAATGAREALISVGAHNLYHHPTPEALTRLEIAGLRVRRTDEEGSFNLYGNYFSFLTEESMRPVPSGAAKSRVYPGSPATASRL